VKVKICGMTNLEDAAMCESLGADALGFVHFPTRTRSIPLEKISEISSSLGPIITKVLVCAPKTVSESLDLVARTNVDVLQVYSLSPALLSEFRDQGGKVIRAVPPVRSEAIRFANCADALLFERGTPGTGSSYDYSQIPIDCCQRAIIAGGLNLENLRFAKSMDPYALDVSSGVESAIGKKDPYLVTEFIRRCKP